jgi:hypothetical protein
MAAALGVGRTDMLFPLGFTAASPVAGLIAAVLGLPRGDSATGDLASGAGALASRAHPLAAAQDRNTHAALPGAARRRWRLTWSTEELLASGYTAPNIDRSMVSEKKLHAHAKGKDPPPPRLPIGALQSRRGGQGTWLSRSLLLGLPRSMLSGQENPMRTGLVMVPMILPWAALRGLGRSNCTVGPSSLGLPFSRTRDRRARRRSGSSPINS